MVTYDDLLGDVDAAFADTSRGLATWPDPHGLDRRPADEEYERLTNPARWRIVGARADAWVRAVQRSGLARVDSSSPIVWEEASGPRVTSAATIVPWASGAMSLVVARSPLGDAADAVLTLAVGSPAVVVTWIPDCGCDACDSGSDDVVAEVDRYVASAATGTLRLLRRGDRQITVTIDGWSASDLPGPHPDVSAILADPVGWREWSGAPWVSSGVDAAPSR